MFLRRVLSWNITKTRGECPRCSHVSAYYSSSEGSWIRWWVEARLLDKDPFTLNPPFSSVLDVQVALTWITFCRWKRTIFCQTSTRLMFPKRLSENLSTSKVIYQMEDIFVVSSYHTCSATNSNSCCRCFFWCMGKYQLTYFTTYSNDGSILNHRRGYRAPHKLCKQSISTTNSRCLCAKAAVRPCGISNVAIALARWTPLVIKFGTFRTQIIDIPRFPSFFPQVQVNP